jgi:hypothetical protein
MFLDKVTAIEFSIVFKQTGIVNWNGSLAAAERRDGGLGSLKVPKWVYGQPTINEDGSQKTNRYLKTSSNAWRAALFAGDMPNALPSVMTDEDLADWMSSVGGMLRGWMRADSPSLKRKSPITTTDAISAEPTWFVKEFRSRQGGDDSDKEAEKKSTQIHEIETAGESLLQATAFLDFEGLCFIPCGSEFGRQAFNKESPFLRLLKEKVKVATKETLDDPSYYARALPTGSGKPKYGEEGILLPPKYVHHLANELLARLAQTQITRTHGLMKTKAIKVSVKKTGSKLGEWGRTEELGVIEGSYIDLLASIKPADLFRPFIKL